MQHWTKIPGLSQEDMETFFQNAMLPGSELKHHGVIPQMDPVFVTCDFVKGTIDMAYRAQEWELNPENIMHGGIISTALDTSMGFLAHYYTHLSAPTVVTVTMNVTFLKPVLAGDIFHIKCQLDSLGRTLATVKAEVRLERDDILAGIATATFMAVNEWGRTDNGYIKRRNFLAGKHGAMDVSAWTSRKPHFQQGRTGAAAAAVCFLRF